MDRRHFLQLLPPALGGLAALDLSACQRFPGLSPEIAVHRPGMAAGHWLRPDARGPQALAEGTVTGTETLETDVLILGSGVAGLTAAWRLHREGRQGVTLLGGPEWLGNGAGGEFLGDRDLRYPTGAHYLPLPSRESLHVRTLLSDLGILRGPVDAEHPEYDETALIHAPEERVFFQGKWQEGLLPREGVSPAEQAEHQRFLQFIGDLRSARGRDGSKAFAIPLVLSSTDPEFRRLDTLTLAAWLTEQGYTSPTLYQYLDYCCRDDYGAGAHQVSAWAGLHYFASRNGHAANAEDGALLTWPEGLARLTGTLLQRIQTGPAPVRCLGGMALEVGLLGIGRSGPQAGAYANCLVSQDSPPPLGGAWALPPDSPPPRPLRIHARQIVVAMPLHIARRVVREMPAARAPALPHAPWLVGNFLLRGFPREPGSREGQAPLAWDNVVLGSPGLGYVVATHQLIRQARPGRTVFTAYRALAGQSPEAARRWLESAPPEELLAAARVDLDTAYGHELLLHLEAVSLTLRGHAMSTPVPGFLTAPDLEALRHGPGPLLFAHSDLSGLSVFEEAAYWGWQAAGRILA